MTGILVDITDRNAVISAVKGYDFIVNCAGLVPKNRMINDRVSAFRINVAGPRNLADACSQYGNKLIHISTDCVFGSQSNKIQTSFFAETDIAMPEGTYALTKYVGEIREFPHLTIRTSFIGLPDPRGRGLLQWAINNAGKSIPGYVNSWWNGITVFSLGRLLQKIFHSGISGILHVHHAQAITKYDLLRIVNDVFELRCTIEPTDYTLDRRLRSVYGNFVETEPYIELLKEVKRKHEKSTKS